MLFGPSSMPLWVFGAWLRRERPDWAMPESLATRSERTSRLSRSSRSRASALRAVEAYTHMAQCVRVEGSKGIFLEGGQLPTQSPQAWSVTQRRHSVAKHLESGGHSSTVGKALTFKLLTN